MLAISPLRSTTDGGHRAGGGDVVEGFSAVGCGEDNFSESFSGGNLLEDIDFDDLFVGFDDGDVLPDLEVDPNEILAEFSVGGEDETSGTTSSTTEVKSAGGDVETSAEGGTEGRREEEGYKGSPTSENMEAVEMEDDGGSTAPTSAANSGEAVAEEGERGRSKSAAAAQAKGSQGKRKVKVDWTADLHRRFVQAVEQLGVDKAVPSRILEIMGIDCLTRHNIASHLQKYRSHRKHLLAREAEAASWSQRRHMYGSGGGGACAAAVAAGGKRGEMAAAAAPWLVPTIGFPPPPPPAHAAAAMQAPFRPLHVWGHPTVDHAMMHMWPKHLVPSRTPPAAPWAPPQAPPNPAFWHHHHLHYPRPVLPSALTQGTPCFPSQPLPPQARYPAPPVPGIPPPHPMYKVPDIAQQHPAPGKQLPQFDLHPSKESIDAALGDVLSKPWLPLPLGLKPPSVDSVLGVLQQQGISKIPPSCA